MGPVLSGRFVRGGIIQGGGITWYVTLDIVQQMEGSYWSAGSIILG